ncbi:MAG: bifunctional ornithine acetyltransferase/N-acetylglutamate synthase [Omnitrophica WOR_2 bacterium RIFCSPLOWO2_02_FULL_63_16]|nr:MAG: bifunctional ornithine acetyltransferase/N-acetylglutamate synthase [Omnitrophica WOR_2 bacterium GWA2_63_20]OGX17346.1 MAG: bifunctional ornithine acetyltransferase/N-acetylglutamate synthase [Omnitrophica WOR_2 bacterium GWF2_63_9]OGX30748.1 MAG: bifunctional ornithine acetyltransferase/N-acetylglutamate synthase [Omnitrophica WOR_2 bacterium RIFCSPHIGHO2_12_FULL_64_13]OGX36598.1 MAG: bifunctional ornithine acetyltransferase/N-acetylglutamate synthase [Omnitrophica WOR_2 bacterium RIFC
MRWVNGGVTAAKGFKAAGVSAGIKRNRKPDLALVVCARPVTAAGVFTRNRVQAAPVVISKARLRRGRAQAVLINSGCANCLTGAPGTTDALRIGRAAAQALGIEEEMVLLASTGLIGRRLPVKRITRAIPSAARRASRRHHEAAAQAILTTDLYAKEAAIESRINGRLCRVGGMAKGAGMIAPSLATMLCVLTTDVAIEPQLLKELLRAAVERSFNRISVDGDMSTNDTVFALASGLAGVRIRRGTAAQHRFARMLNVLTQRLAARLVKDGEGVTRIATVDIRGARTEAEANACARQVANSPLVKTMLAGSDPNVGRIAAAVGASEAHMDPRKLEIRISGQRVVSRGTALRLSKSVTRTLLRRPEVPIRVDLHAGRAQGAMMSGDLTEEYVRINAGYAT